MSVVQQAPATGELADKAARRRNLVLVGWCALAGAVLAVIWSPAFVDRVIAGAIANPIVGGEAEDVVIEGSTAALVFAFVTGVGGMFTACNVAVFGALAPLSARPGGAASPGTAPVRARLAAVLRPLGWLTLGAVAVAGLYGAVGVYLGESLPQLSEARIGDPEDGLSVRIIQSTVVFTLLGAVMIWYALAAARLVKNPLAGVFAKHRWAEPVFLGAMVGAFLIGRPFGMFRNMYSYAAATDNPFLGFATFALQSLGNLAGVAVLLVLVTLLSRGRFQDWLLSKQGRAARFTAGAFVLFGTFFVFYWGIKTGSRAGVLWWPEMPYNAR